MSSSIQEGNLILLDSDGKEVIYKPINNILHVGSDNTANVCLSGLKNLAFSIFIDTFGRVTFSNFMKRVKLNGKRIPKNVDRSLMNNSSIEILDYKFCWKYNPKFSKSYSMSPCKKPTLSHDVEATARNRKTMSCFAPNCVNDENITKAAASDEGSNFEKPVNTPAKKIVNDKVKETTSTKKRSTLLPVKENRTSELRRKSIVKSISVSDETKSLQYVTPKKPIPSAAMVKSVNAIMRTESRVKDDSRKAQRNTLDSTVTFPSIIQKSGLFTVVTDEMKTVGPSAYVSSKFATTDSPKRTPRKLIQKQKRLSLRSEVSELGLYKQIPEDTTSSKDQEEADIILTNNEDEESTSQHQPANVLESEIKSERKSIMPVPNVSSIEIIDDTLESLVVSDDDDDVVIPEVKIVKQETSEMSSDDSSSSDSIISVDDDSDHGEDAGRSKNATSSNIEIDSDIESPMYEVLTSNSGVPSELNNEKSEEIQVETPSKFASDTSPEVLTEGNETSTNSSTSVEAPSKIVYDTSTEVLTEGNESQVSSISTPTRRESLIRKRRNSRLCSLDECCSPAVTGTPTKNKLPSIVISTPRSILKTPKTLKTPKKNVRILDTILHEEEDETPKSSSLTSAETTNPLDVTFDKECESEINDSSATTKSSQMSTPDQPIDSIEILSSNEMSTPEQPIETIEIVSSNEMMLNDKEDEVEPSNVLDVTFDCEKEINNSSVANKSTKESVSSIQHPADTVVVDLSNEAVLPDKEIEAQKRISVHPAESSNLLNTTFDKESDDQVNDSPVTSKTSDESPVSTIEQPIESSEEFSKSATKQEEESLKSSSINQVVANKSSSQFDLSIHMQKRTNFDDIGSLQDNEAIEKNEIDLKDEIDEKQNEVPKSTADTVEIDSNNKAVLPDKEIEAQKRISVHPAESSNLLNTTFDKESDDQVNDSHTVSKTSDESPVSTVEQPIDLVVIDSNKEIILPEKDEETQKFVSINQAESSNLLDMTFDNESNNEANKIDAGTKLSEEFSKSSTEQEEETLKSSSSNRVCDNSSSHCDLSIHEQKQANFDDIGGLQDNEAIEKNETESKDELDEKQNEVAKSIALNRSKSSNIFDTIINAECDLEKSSSVNEIEMDSNHELVLLEGETKYVTEKSIYRAESLNLFDASFETEYDNENSCENKTEAIAFHSNETSNSVTEQAIEENNDLIVKENDLTKSNSTEIKTETLNVSDVTASVESDEKENSKKFVNPQPTHSSNEEEVVIDSGKTKSSGLTNELELINDGNMVGDRDFNNDSVLRGQEDDISIPSSSNKDDTSNLKESFDMEGDNESSGSHTEIANKIQESAEPHGEANLDVSTNDMKVDNTNGLDEIGVVKELFKTPKAVDRTNFVGMKELLNTPDDTDRLDNIKGVKELFYTPKPLDRTNFVGIKELLHSPDDTDGLANIKGVKELFNTPKAHDRTNFVGMKELLNTPDGTDGLDNIKGVKELFKISKPSKDVDFDGVKEMLQTPMTSSNSNSSINPSSDVTKEFSSHVNININCKSRGSFVRKIGNALSAFGIEVHDTMSQEQLNQNSEIITVEEEATLNDKPESSKITSQQTVAPSDLKCESNGVKVQEPISEKAAETPTSSESSEKNNEEETATNDKVDIPIMSQIEFKSTPLTHKKALKTKADTEKEDPTSSQSSESGQIIDEQDAKTSEVKTSEIQASTRRGGAVPSSSQTLKRNKLPGKQKTTDEIEEQITTVVSDESTKPKKMVSKDLVAVTSSSANKSDEQDAETDEPKTSEMKATTRRGRVVKGKESNLEIVPSSSQTIKRNKRTANQKTADEIEEQITPVDSVDSAKPKKIVSIDSEGATSSSVNKSDEQDAGTDEPKTFETKAATRRGRAVKGKESNLEIVPSSSQTIKRNKRTVKQKNAEEIEEQIAPVVSDGSTKHKKMVSKDLVEATSSSASKSEEQDVKTDEANTSEMKASTRRGRAVKKVESQAEIVPSKTTLKQTKRTAKQNASDEIEELNIPVVSDDSTEHKKIVSADLEEAATKSKESKTDDTLNIVTRRQRQKSVVQPASERTTRRGTKRNMSEDAQNKVDLDGEIESDVFVDVPTRKNQTKKITESEITKEKGKTAEVPTSSSESKKQSAESSNKTNEPRSSKQPSTNVVLDDSETATSKKSARALSKRRDPSEVDSIDAPVPATQKQNPKRLRGQVNDEDSMPVQPKLRGKKNVRVSMVDQEPGEIAEPPKPVTRKALTRGRKTSEVDSLEVAAEKTAGSSKPTKTNTVPLRKRLRSVNVGDKSPSVTKRPKRGAK